MVAARRVRTIHPRQPEATYVAAPASIDALQKPAG